MAESNDLNLIRTTNHLLEKLFNERKALLSLGGGQPKLSEIRSELEAVFALVTRVGAARQSDPRSRPPEFATELNQYAANLGRLKSYLLALQAYAETRKKQLASEGVELSQTLAWCDALKLTKLE